MEQDIQELFDDALRQHQAGRLAEAERLYQRILAIDPRHADSLHCLGALAFQGGRHDAAANLMEQAIRLKGDAPVFHYNLGRVLREQGRLDEAAECYKRAIAINPNFAEACNNLGALFNEQGKLDKAEACYLRAIAINPNFAEAYNNLGALFKEQRKLDEAAACYRHAAVIRPDYAEAHYNLGSIFRAQGKLDEAREQYERAIAIRPDYAEAHLGRSEFKTFHQGDPDLAALEALAGRKGLPENKALYIHFALAKALEDSGDYGRAFEHLRTGNALKRGQINYNEKAVQKLFRRISHVFDSGLFERFQGAGDPSPVPVFVLGMARSGSTLVEQILASHPQIHGAGELSDLESVARSASDAGDPPAGYPECIPALDGAALRRLGQSYLDRLPALADGKVRIIDKTPGNFLNIGLIRLILPHAKIIHTVRDPIDTCVSCYSILFSNSLNFSYDLAELGRYYRCYSELMTHWRAVLPPGALLDVVYEDLVDDLEGQSRRLIDYCGLPWDDRCLGFHTNSRPVGTASAVQVRRPLFRSSLQRWRRYEAGIAPLLHELGDIVPVSTPVQAGGTTGTHGSE